ncbi:hypothetical protein GCM10009117_17980 [Gangjinia marincola]|uniref:Uncharacterized protein n=1 Tax=Gangjinia marincola TaxID=578463 RepID=A0ABP3XTL4_9FLAO
MKKRLTYTFTAMMLMINFMSFGQNKEVEKAKKEARETSIQYMEEAEDALSENDFASAEANYRKAIATDPENTEAKYNMGNLYYNKEYTANAQGKYTTAGKNATEKALRHKSFHNQGNTFMKQKQYDKAVEAYKNALRNNPTDDETRYNLALAKSMLEKDGSGGDDQDKDQQGGDGDNKNENQGDQGENQDNKDKQDHGDQGKDQKENDQEKGEDKQDKGGDPKDGKDKEQPKGDQQKEQQQPKKQKGQLSPQQIKNLLDAIKNQEEKVQEKVNVQKGKGAQVKPEKDW